MLNERYVSILATSKGDRKIWASLQGVIKEENINICYSVLVLSFKKSLYKSTFWGVCMCVCLEQMTWGSEEKIARLW